MYVVDQSGDLIQMFMKGTSLREGAGQFTKQAGRQSISSTKILEEKNEKQFFKYCF